MEIELMKHSFQLTTSHQLQLNYDNGPNLGQFLIARADFMVLQIWFGGVVCQFGGISALHSNRRMIIIIIII